MNDVQSWHDRRRQGIGGSDAPILVGVSPYKTAYALWEEKMGIVPVAQAGWAADRGNNLEPKARAHYELHHGEDMPPAAFVNTTPFKHIFANLDGFNPLTRKILEIKCPGKEDHETAKAGKIPEKYIPQLVHQLFAADGLSADYWSFDGENGVIVPFERSAQLEAEYLPKAHAFWNLVVEGTPPPLSDKDFKKLKEKEAVDAFMMLKLMKDRLDQAEDEYKKIMDLAKTLMGDHRRVICNNIKLVQVFAKGSIDYTKVPEVQKLAQEYLDQYRRKGSLSVRPYFPKS